MKASSRRLYPSQADSKLKGRRLRPAPDWAELRAELARRDHQVTLALLWQEYKAEQPDGYQYSQFCDLYRRFEKRLSVVLRQVHRGGEKTFVDFCDGIPLIDVKTGELIPTELFVGALGASSYTFARAALSQELPVWLDCHARMYTYFEGVSALTICDNLRSGVTHPDRYEAEVNATYRDFASHFGTCVLPTRIRKPRDKACVSYCLPFRTWNGERRSPWPATSLALVYRAGVHGFIQEDVVPVPFTSEVPRTAPLVNCRRRDM
jgi:transposase